MCVCVCGGGGGGWVCCCVGAWFQSMYTGSIQEVSLEQRNMSFQPQHFPVTELYKCKMIYCATPCHYSVWVFLVYSYIRLCMRHTKIGSFWYIHTSGFHLFLSLFLKQIISVFLLKLLYKIYLSHLINFFIFQYIQTHCSCMFLL